MSDHNHGFPKHPGRCSGCGQPIEGVKGLCSLRCLVAYLLHDEDGEHQPPLTGVPTESVRP